MAQTVVLNGVSYEIPDVGEDGWGQNVTDYLVALSVVAGATPALINVVSVTTTPVSILVGRTYLVDTSRAKTLQLPVATSNFFFIVRDVTGSAATNNITIARNGSESIDGVAANKTLSRAYGTWLIASNGTNWYTLNMFPDTGIVNTDISASAAISYSKLAALTVSRALVSSGSGAIEVSAVTSTEIGYLSGVTSAIQTQISAKAPIASPSFTGSVTLTIPASDNGILITDGGSNYNSLFQMSRNGTVKLKMTTGSGIGHLYGNGGLNLGGALDTEHIQIDSNGNLGVGAAPIGNLYVANTGSVILTVKTTSTSGTRSAIVRLNELNTGGSDGSGQLLFTYDTDYKQAAAIKAILTGGGAAGILSFYTSTTERIRIDDIGNVGIGDSPGYRLDVVGAPNDDIINIRATGAGTLGIRMAPTGASSNAAKIIATLNGTNTDLAFRTAGANRLTISGAGSGEIGIGVAPETGYVLKTAGYAQFTNVGDTDPLTLAATSSGHASLALTHYGSSAALRIRGVADGTTTALNILAGGSLRMAISGQTGYLTCLGVYSQTSASAANVVVDSSGNIMRSTSARKYKKEVVDLPIEMARKILKMETKIYKSKSPSDDPETLHYGLIADDVDHIDPTVVSYYRDESSSKIPDGVQYDRITVPLLKVVQSHDERITDIEKKLMGASK